MGTMPKLIIPGPLQIEFATLEAIWHSTAKTRRIDALVLAWVKYEKQLRRLFCFLVFQHPKMKSSDIDNIIAAMAENRHLYPETFIKGIDRIGVSTVAELMGCQYKNLREQIDRIKKYRNKMIHGQMQVRKSGHGS